MICEEVSQVHIRLLGKVAPARVLISDVWVYTTTTTCHFGGTRNWFLCPSCKRRCANLYPRECRKCINAHYAVEAMSLQDRRIERAIKMRKRLGQHRGGIVAPFPQKPKRMRLRTYLLLQLKSLILERAIWNYDHAKLFGTEK